jgi:myosin heavy subunit
MRAPFVEDLEKQRLKRTNYLLVKLQAVCRGRFYRQVCASLRVNKLCFCVLRLYVFCALG